MPIIVSSNQKQYPKAPEGAHRAACIGIFDIGTQVGGQFGPRRQVVLMWELSDEKMEDGRPFAISETFTMSLNEKANLRKKIDAWLGSKKLTEEQARNFDLAKMLGRPCQLQIVHNVGTNGNTYANISAIMAMPKGMALPDIENELKQFSITDPEIPSDLPKWVAEKIRNSEEWKAKSRVSSGSGSEFDEFADRVASSPASGSGPAPGVATPGGPVDPDDIPF